MMSPVANRELVEEIEAEVDQAPLAETVSFNNEGSRDPRDIPYRESGIERPILHNPIRPGGTYYAHEKDDEGRVHTRGKIKVWAGQYRVETPRQADWALEHMRKLLNGNDPSRWVGENLDASDREYCECGFSALNSRVMADHRKFWRHQTRIK
jgi:hypothetical protein